MKRVFFTAAALSLAIAPAALAQDASLRANYGEVRLNAGFMPDPHTVRVVAGGNIDASRLGNNCRGSISRAPDYQVTYRSGDYPLIFRTQSGSDTTLVINGADGRWYCDDDSGGGLNARVTFSRPQSGVYDVWVGTFGGGTAPAQLLVTEVDDSGARPQAGGGGGQAAGGPDFRLPANYGSTRLRAGFEPDPHRVRVVAGGDIDASSLGNNCRGSISRAPDYEVTYTAGQYPLIFQTRSQADTTLVINGPDGRWTCDDDSGGALNARVTYNRPASGTYDVWVGRFGGGTAPAELQVTEIPQTDEQGETSPPPRPEPRPPGPNAGGPDFRLPANFGSVRLRSGYTPDPHRVRIVAGGNLDASQLGNNCRGSISRAPDFELSYTAGNLPLAFRTRGSADVTLVINGPDGRWYCDDDGGGGVNAQVLFRNPASGTYDVWVGTYRGGTAPTSLEITEVP